MNKGRKPTGKKYHQRRKKRLYEKTSVGIKTIIGERKTKEIRERGGNIKTISLKANIANIKTPQGIKRAEIKKVTETPQNVFLARQNILMKSAIIETSLGKAKITNRPSREGQINAVLIE
jgi:small subunit ribosomal protein S8e